MEQGFRFLFKPSMRFGELRQIEALKDDCLAEGHQTLIDYVQTVLSSGLPLLNWVDFGSLSLSSGRLHSMSALARLQISLGENEHPQSENRKQSVNNT